MALNFGLLDPDAPAKIAGSVYAGQQARQEQQDRNMLRQQQAEQLEIQRQNMLGLREDRLAQAQQRKADLASATESKQWLNKVAELWDPKIPLNSQTAAQGLQYALKSGDKNAIDMMQKTVQAFRDEEQFQTEMGRLAPKAAPVAPAVSGTLGSGTFGITPAPANALAPAAAPAAAAPTNALTGGYTRPQIEQMLVSPNARVREMGKNLLGALPKEDSRYNVPGVGLVDATGRVIIPSVEKPAAPPVSIAEYERAQQDPQFMRFLQERAIAMRPPRPEPAPRTQQLTLSDGSVVLVNMDSGVTTPVTLGGAPVQGKPSATEEKAAVSEQQAAYNIGRVLTAANQIKEIGKEDPDSAQPGLTEALASSIGMGGTANLARNANRQIVQGAQRDALDALLYLATGAAYNKEQLQGQMDAYIPAFTDKPAAVAAKKARMANLIESAKVRAGKAWTPEMDRAMTALTGSAAPPAVVPGRTPAPAVVQGTGGFKYLGKESK